MLKDFLLFLILIKIFLGFLLNLKEKTKKEIEITNVEVMEAQIDSLIIPDRRQGGGIR